MGCDIHIWAEVETENGWEICGEIFNNAYYDPEKPQIVCEDGYIWNTPLVDAPYQGRCYYLFSILADVRNDGSTIPLAMPRGIPKDATEAYKKKVKDYGIDGHSHSYFTLEELLLYNWEEETQYTGLVDPKNYIELKNNNFSKAPSSYCSWASGKIISNEEMEELIEQGVKKDEYCYTLAKWTEPVSAAVGRGWQKTMDKLKELAEKAGGNDKVRIVFFFDS